MEIRTPEMLTDEQKRKMVEALREHLGIFTHADFARKMGISPQNAYAWLQRGAFNAELVAVKCPEISGDWLLTGKGPMLKAERDAAPAAVPCNPDELKRLVDAITEEQKLAAKAMAQTDKVLELMNAVTRMMKSGE